MLMGGRMVALRMMLSRSAVALSGRLVGLGCLRVTGVGHESLRLIGACQMVSPTSNAPRSNGFIRESYV